MIEFDRLCMLFDYSEGVLPEIPEGKELMVFVSHRHSDHYSQKIFQIKEFHKETSYVLSYDIGTLVSNDVLTVLPDKDYTTVAGGELLKIKTLRSTDCGVAYLIDYCGKVIYHSGDLHMWVWQGASEYQNREMENTYIKEISKALMNISVLLVVLTKEAEDSAWVPSEISSAKGSKKTLLGFKPLDYKLCDDFNFLFQRSQIYSAYNDPNYKNTIVNIIKNCLNK